MATNSVVRINPQTMTASAQPGDLDGFISQWLAEVDVAARTKDAYRKGIYYYRDYLNGEALTGSSRADVLAYKGHLQATYKPGTVSTYLVPVRRFYTWLHATTGTPNITAGIKGAKPSTGHAKDALTEHQVGDVLAAITGPTATRDRALLALMVGTGVRVIEVTRASVGDLRSSGGATVLDVWGKGHESKDALVVIRPNVERLIRAYLASRGPLTDDAPLFASASNRNPGGRMTTRSVSRVVKETLAAAGLTSSRLTAHSMRHTAVTLALLGGAPLEDVQAMARHTNISTTQIYAHALNRIEDAAEGYIDAALDRALGLAPRATA